MNKLTYVLSALLISGVAHAQQDFASETSAAPQKTVGQIQLRKKNAASETSAAPRKTVGQIQLRKKNTDRPCVTLDIHPRNAAFMGNYECKNDQVYDFRLIDAQKGNIIVLGSDNPHNAASCPKKDWLFTMEVIDDLPLLTGWISIDSLRMVGTGGPVLTGLKMKNNQYSHGNIAGKLSCVDTM